MAELPRAHVRRRLRLAFGAVAALFVVLVAVDLVRQFDPAGLEIDWAYIVTASIPAGAAMFLQFLGWRTLIEQLSGVLMPFLPACVVYLDSQMARYTPGKVGLAAVRVAGAASVGVSARILGSALFVELASWTATGFLCGFSFLFLALAFAPLPWALDGGPLGLVRRISWFLALAALAGVAILCLVDRRHFPLRLNRLLLGPIADEPGRGGPLAPLRLPLWHVAHWAAWTLAGAFLAWGLGAGVAEALAAGAFLCIAIVAGFLALVAPAGAGVREAVIAAATTPLLGASAALAFGVLARAAALVGEVGLWLGARWLRVRAGRAFEP